jgi:hypothetical protein
MLYSTPAGFWNHVHAQTLEPQSSALKATAPWRWRNRYKSRSRAREPSAPTAAGTNRPEAEITPKMRKNQLRTGLDVVHFGSETGG